MPYCTGKGLSRPRWCVRRSKSRCVALTSSSKWIGFPDSRVRTKTILITTSILRSVCNTRPMRYVIMLYFLSFWSPHPNPLPDGEGTGWLLLTRALPAMHHIFPVVESHMARDQGPFPHSWPYPNNRMDSPNGHAWDVLVEPGS